MLGFSLALFTTSHSTGIPLLGDIGQASVIVRKLSVEILDAVAKMACNRPLDCDLSPSEHN
jgi:hypothetical protein